MQGCSRPLGNDEQRLSFPFDKSSVPLQVRIREQGGAAWRAAAVWYQRHAHWACDSEQFSIWVQAASRYPWTVQDH